jgi:hypothetical protein
MRTSNPHSKLGGGFHRKRTTKPPAVVRSMTLDSDVMVPLDVKGELSIIDVIGN